MEGMHHVHRGLFRPIYDVFAWIMQCAQFEIANISFHGFPGIPINFVGSFDGYENLKYKSFERNACIRLAWTVISFNWIYRASCVSFHGNCLRIYSAALSQNQLKMKRKKSSEIKIEIHSSFSCFFARCHGCSAFLPYRISSTHYHTTTVASWEQNIFVFHSN